MSDEAALLAAIYANHDEDTPRLVYADWLDEHGQPERAEFIRLQVELDNCDDHASSEYQRLNDRAALLQSQHYREWLAHLSEFDEARLEGRIAVGFVRGFPESLSFSDALDDDFAILRNLPHLRSLDIEGVLPSPEPLHDIARLTQLDKLTTDNAGIDGGLLYHLEPLPCWTHVDLLEDGLDQNAWRAFQERRISKVALLAPEQQREAAIRYVRGLQRNNAVRPGGLVKSVSLIQEFVTDGELRLLSYLPELEEIEISEGRETAAGLEHLSKLPNLKRIYLWRGNAESLVPLMKCETLETIEYYGSAWAQLSDEGVLGLERLKNLQYLTLESHSGLRDKTLQSIGKLSELRTLNIDLGKLDDENSLLALLNLSQLESLTLNGREYKGDQLQQFRNAIVRVAEVAEKPTYGFLE